MFLRNSLLLSCVILNALFGFGQSLAGFVYDEANQPIPYTKVYLKNYENVGGITDLEGKFSFGCDLGTHTVVYKCVGFQDLEVKVTVNNIKTPTVQNVYLKQKDNQLGEVEIKTKRKNVG